MKTYGPGILIENMTQFEVALSLGHLLYVKNWDKTAHPVILANMQYRVVKRFVESGQISLARKI